MGDVEGADYAAALGGEQTELAPSESGTEAHTAWALDDSPEWKQPFWSTGRITVAAVSVAVVLAAGAGVVAWTHMRDQGDSVAATSAAPTTKRGWGGPPINRPSPKPLPPPPPSTVTVTAPAPPPKTVTPEPEPVPTYQPVNMAAFDGQFISNMKAQGWVIWNEAQSADTARLACSMLTNGASFEYVANHLATVSQARIEEGRVFTSTAMRTYPNCP